MQKTGIRYVFSLFSANALQIVFSQLGSLFLFWLASKELPKNDFGNFNWYFAIYGTLAAVFSFGFDFIVIKRVSAKNDLDAARIQLLQSIVICALSLVPVVFILCSSSFSARFRETLMILVAFQFTYLSMPFKNALTGKELFARSARAVIVSNSLKIALVLGFYLADAITLFNVSLVLALSNITELIFYLLGAASIFEKKFFAAHINFAAYKDVLRESLPQLGVIVFDSAFARIDWILLGYLSGANADVKTAEYSFAYKLFELSRLPLLILAPILFTRFTRLLHRKEEITGELRSGIVSFFKLSLMAGMAVPLLLNMLWVPTMLFFTSGKYGPENHHIYFLLSLTLPFMYMINFLWTIAFAQGQLKLTMVLSVINSSLNIVLNLALIPSFGETGAAIAFLACNVVMLPVYLKKVNQASISLPFRQGLWVIGLALLTGIISYFIPAHGLVQALIAVTLYLLLLYGLRIFTITELKLLKHFVKKD